MALLKSIQHQPEPIHTSLVLELAETGDEELRLVAAQAMAGVHQEVRGVDNVLPTSQLAQGIHQVGLFGVAGQVGEW